MSGRSVRDLERAERRSRQAIPVSAAMLAALAFGFWLLGRFVDAPPWLVVVEVIALGLTAFALIGDLLNVAYCRRRLRRTATETEARGPVG